MDQVNLEALRQTKSGQVLIDLIDRSPELIPCLHALGEAVRILTRIFTVGGKLLICGNGGSAADAQHMVGELMKEFRCQRPLPASFRDKLAGAGDATLADCLQVPLPAIALSGSSPLATAICNDMDARLCFAQQVLGYGRTGDAFLAISTSGNAKNVVAAARVARAQGLRTIGLTGRDGGCLAPLVEVAIKVPATETYRVQELHLPIYHALCAAVEEEIFGE